MTSYEYIIISVGGLVFGYAGFLLLMRILPRRLQTDNTRQREDILEDARKQAVARKTSAHERTEEKLQMMEEELDASIAETKEDLKLAEEDIDAREYSSKIEESRLSKVEKEIENHQKKIASRKQSLADKSSNLKELNVKVMSQLETLSECNADRQQTMIRDQVIEAFQLDCQKFLKLQEEDLQITQRRVAKRMISRVLSRYMPDFSWPKIPSFLELSDVSWIEVLKDEERGLIATLKEKSEIEIELLADDEHSTPILKFMGGAGVNREAVKLTFSEILPKGHIAWGKAAIVYDKHRAALEKQAMKHGENAARLVGVKDLHPELLKLIGYLYWRTSYRQNQWFHTVEVAQLCGLLAREMGVDSDEAKRCGILHDIGKALDYNIEGSHAVISADYADRYGESKVICDTIMSHHNDLVVETPLAYILVSADTMSGARPGARANLEEGYQIRLSGIDGAVRSFPGISSLAIMNGGREVHVEVNHKKVNENDLESLTQGIARKIEEEVAFPGEIKVLVSRRFEATATA